jgi:hypothetical protein
MIPLGAFASAQPLTTLRRVIHDVKNPVLRYG